MLLIRVISLDLTLIGKDCGYTALNIHEIWPRFLWGEHILYIRPKMTPFLIFVD